MIIDFIRGNMSSRKVTKKNPYLSRDFGMNEGMATKWPSFDVANTYRAVLFTLL